MGVQDSGMSTMHGYVQTTEGMSFVLNMDGMEGRGVYAGEGGGGRVGSREHRMGGGGRVGPAADAARAARGLHSLTCAMFQFLDTAVYSG